MLFWRGELMIRERRGFQSIYDLTERVLPAGTDTREPTADEMGRFIVRRALGALGVAGEGRSATISASATGTSSPPP